MAKNNVDTKWQEINKKFDEALKPKNFNKYMKKVRGKKARNQKRLFKEIESWLKDGHQKNMADFITYLAEQHGESHIDLAHLKGIEPAPNELLSALFDYAEKFGKKSKPLVEPMLPTETYEFMEYKFETVWGQGMIHTVYDPNDEVVISI